MASGISSMFNEKEPVLNSCTRDWAFIDELKSELHRKPLWTRFYPNPGELDLRSGIVIHKGFPDPEGLLDTAWQDLERFMKDIGIYIKTSSEDDSDITIRAIKEEFGCYESYCMDIEQTCITIRSGDTEGIRRGVFFLEDLILRSEGPFLTLGCIKRTPWMRNRISRCFFGPIKRPPFNRDELMDEIDYYSNEYLNRLSHEGINVLWITAEFRDLVKTDLVPEYGKDRVKRLCKLQKTIDHCRKYGIKIFLFCIEPKIWGPEDPLVVRHPEVAGARSGRDICFCPFSRIAQQYLYDGVKSIFVDVPKLGGMISITHGERTTSCLSSVPAVSDTQVPCPVCSQKEKGEILEATHIPILTAMHEVNPDAQFVSWLYMPQVQATADWKYTIPEKLPKEAVLTFNFESGAEKEQLGRIRRAGDYWQSYIGPSERFIKMAKAAGEAGIPLGAKIQVGCSHEVATIPFVPVPSVLWEKYRAMNELNVSSVIQSWYFGNYPGIMNKAAGELAYEDFTESQDQFLYRLAKIDWGVYAEQVIQAWKLFHKAYDHYPMDTVFQYYGPMHDGVVWPLHLFPVHKPLAPTWKLDFPVSGDSIGECLSSFTLKEAVTLCRQMSKYWNQGVDILNRIEPELSDHPQRLKDICVAKALDIQFESGFNILRFYDLRERILENQGTTDELTSYLDHMQEIVKGEIGLSKKMVELCQLDSRLGFHSECEGYKYSRGKLEWRVRQLEYLLENDFPKMRMLITQQEQLIRMTTPFDAPVYNCNDDVPAKGKTFEWTASVDENRLRIQVVCSRMNPNVKSDYLYLHIKAGDLGYPYNFTVDLNVANKRRPYIDTYIGFPIDCFYGTVCVGEKVIADFEINLDRLPGYRGQSALAASIVRYIKTDSGEIKDEWSGENPHIRYRLCLSAYNPEVMGRLELH